VLESTVPFEVDWRSMLFAFPNPPNPKHWLIIKTFRSMSVNYLNLLNR